MTEMDATQLRLLKNEFRICYLIIILAFCLAGLINFAYMLENFSESDLVYIGVLNLAVFTLIFGALYFLNKDVYRDLKCKEVQVIKTVILEKKECPDYEPGSGSLFIPVLGNLFPKLWGQEMKQVCYYQIITKEKRVEVEKGVYENLQIGDEVILLYAKYSKTFLGIKKG